jgi:hypothetical protein
LVSALASPFLAWRDDLTERGCIGNQGREFVRVVPNFCARGNATRFVRKLGTRQSSSLRFNDAALAIQRRQGAGVTGEFEITHSFRAAGNIDRAFPVS